ncbi:MAG: hypothetical protein WC705_02585 [Candidatus Paceibacterota bacterium]|jgi:hypothetical protein
MQTLNFKNPFVIFGIIVIIFVGYWILGGLTPDKIINLSKDSADVVKSNNSQQLGDLSWVENPNDVAKDLSQTSLENLTSKLSENISSEFLSQVDFSQASSSPKNLIDQLNGADLNDPKTLSFLKNNPLGFLYSIPDKSIKISSDNSSQKAVEYIFSYTSIMSEVAGQKSQDPQDLLEEITSVIESQDQGEMSQMAFNLNKGFDRIIQLEVPSGLVELHKQNLMIFKNSAIVFGALAYKDNDPLKAYLAAMNGSDLIIKETDKADLLFKEASKKYSL